MVGVVANKGGVVANEGVGVCILSGKCRSNGLVAIGEWSVLKVVPLVI